jgi:hypothetical protein
MTFQCSLNYYIPAVWTLLAGGDSDGTAAGPTVQQVLVSLYSVHQHQHSSTCKVRLTFTYSIVEDKSDYSRSAVWRHVNYEKLY